MSAARVPIPDQPGYWRKGKRVTFKYRDHRRRQRWASAPTIAAAKKLRAQLETDVARGEFSDTARVAFDAYARAWIDTYTGRTRGGLGESTRDDYRKRLEQDAIPFFGSMRLNEIRPVDVKAFAAHVAGRGVKANTVRLALAPVKLLFATAFEDGTIRINPAAGVRIALPEPELADEDDCPVKAMAPAQLWKLLKRIAAEFPAWHLFFWLLADLGLRIGEAIELRWKDVDLGTRTVRIRRTFYRGRVGKPKSRFGRRTLRLTPELATALWELRKATRAGDEELVFTAERGGRLDASNLMGRVLKDAAKPLGLGWVNFHTFRHTCATSLFRAGWNAKQVQLWLGHHKASFTIDTYVHLLPDDVPDPVAIAAGGTQRGTQSMGNDPNAEAAENAEKAHGYAVEPATPSQAETVAADF